MRALVTGGTGFIGSHLAESLVREGYDVTCLVRDTSKPGYLEGLGVTMIRGDCRERDSLTAAVRGAEYIFHLAGLTKARDEHEFHEVNVKGTENVVRAALEGNRTLKRFVHLSSLAAVGPSDTGRPLAEDCEHRPVSAYGRSKSDGERAVYDRRNEMPVTIIRPPVVYGPRDRDLLVFFKLVKAGFVPYWGKSYYSFVYVEDLVRAIILSALSDKAQGEIFFVSDGATHESDEVVDAIAEALEKRPLKVRIPMCLMTFAGAISERTKSGSIINKDKIEEMRHRCWTCDGSKAEGRLQFVAKVKMREGVRWTTDWYKIHRWL